MTTATRPQHMTALAHANRVRLEAACWRRQVTEAENGRELLAAVLEQAVIPEHVGSLSIERFITAPRFMGPNKAEGLLRRAGVRAYAMRGRERVRASAVVRVRDLNLRERSALVRELRGE